MKKLITLTVVAAMLLAMSACGGDGNAETTAKGTDAATVAGTEATTDAETKADGTSASTSAETELETSESSEDTTVGEDETEPSYDYPRAPEDASIGFEQEKLFYGVDPNTGVELEDVLMHKDAKLSPGGQRGIKFTVAENAWVSIISLACPNYIDEAGSLLFEVYRWVEVDRTDDMDEKAYLKACYEATVGRGECVISQLYENFTEEILQIMYEDDLNMSIGNGTYLFVVSNPDEEDLGVGIWNDGFDTDLPFHENNNTYVSDIVHFSGNGNVKTRGYMRMVLELTFIESED